MIKKSAHIFLSIVLTVLVLVSASSFSVYRMDCFVSNQTYYDTTPFDDCCKTPAKGINSKCCDFEVISFELIDARHSLFTNTSVDFPVFNNMVFTPFLKFGEVSTIVNITQNKAPPLLRQSIIILHSVFRI